MLGLTHMVDIISGGKITFSVDGLLFTGVILDISYLAQLLHLVEKMASGVELCLSVDLHLQVSYTSMILTSN